jgi:protocatechuate 3,4-dioxygenase beta subunit
MSSEGQREDQLVRARALVRAVLGVAWFALAILVFSAPCVPSAHAEAAFVSAPNRYDFRFDDARGLLYITAPDRVLRYDVVSGRFLAPWILGGHLRGMDVSPDGRTLVVADYSELGGVYPVSRYMRLCFVDLESGKATDATLPRLYWEHAPSSVVYGADGRVMVCTGDTGPNASLRLYDPSDGSIVTLSANDAWLLTRSADYGTIGMLNGRAAWSLFSPTGGFVVRSPWPEPPNQQWRAAIAVNRNGSKSALFTSLYPAEYRAVVRLFDRAQVQIDEYSPPGGLAWGLGFSHQNDNLYVAAASTPWVVAYDTASSTETARYDIGEEITEGAFSAIAVSADDGLLAAFVPAGARVLRIRPALQGTVRSLYGAPVGGAVVELWKQTGETWSVDATAATGPGGSWSRTTEDTAPVRVHVSDPSGVHAPGWVGGDSLESATSAVATTALQVSADTTLTLVTPGSIEGTLTSSLENRAAAGANVSVYLGEIAGSPVTTVSTDDDGHYQVDVAPGDYRLAFADPSGAHQSAYYQSASSAVTARTVRVRGPTTAVATQTLTFIPFKMAGTVRSEYRSQSIGSALVELWQRGESGSYSLLTTVTAGAGGAWSFEPTQSAPVRVRASDPSGMHDPIWLGGSDLDGATDVVPTRGIAANADIAMLLTHPGLIVGTVRNDWQSTPVGGVTVTLAVADGTTTTPVATTVTAEDGTYLFPAIGPSAYLVSFSDPTGAHVPISPPALASVSTTSAVTCDATMHFVPLQVRGCVRSSFHEVPLPSASVEIWRRGASHAWGREATVTAGGDGTWSYSTDSSAAVRIRVSDPSLMNDPAWFGNGSDVESAADLIPARGTVLSSDVTLGLARPASLTGYVFDSYTESATPDVEVRLCLNAPGTPVIATTTVDVNGAFGFGGLGYASYYMYLEDPSGAYLPQWWYEGGSFAGANSFVLSSPGEWWFTDDVYLDRAQIQYDALFSAPQVMAPYPYLAGDVITLTTSLSETLWGDGLEGINVALEKSTDGVSWARADDAVISDEGYGDYSATVVPQQVGARFYRFTAGPDKDIVSVRSSAVMISPQYRPAKWDPLVLWSSGATTAVLYGSDTKLIRGYLRNADGEAVAVSPVVLEGSSDGVNYTPLLTVAPDAPPYSPKYSVRVPGTLASYLRLRLLPGGMYQPVVSSAVRIKSPWVIRVTAAPKKHRANRKYQLRGQLTPMFAPASATVSMSIQRRKKSYWKAAGTYRVRVSGRDPSFRFSVKLKRGTYRLRLEAPAGGLRLRKWSPYYTVTVR